MTKENIKKSISSYLNKYFSPNEVKAFLYGSSIKKGRFFDVDVGLLGSIDREKITRLRYELEESNFPYKIDLVDFNEVNDSFKNQVFKDKIIWLNF